jgi:hypothetical protein
MMVVEAELVHNSLDFTRSVRIRKSFKRALKGRSLKEIR